MNLPWNSIYGYGFGVHITESVVPLLFVSLTNELLAIYLAGVCECVRARVYYACKLVARALATQIMCTTACMEWRRRREREIEHTMHIPLHVDNVRTRLGSKFDPAQWFYALLWSSYTKRSVAFADILSVSQPKCCDNCSLTQCGWQSNHCSLWVVCSWSNDGGTATQTKESVREWASVHCQTAKLQSISPFAIRTQCWKDSLQIQWALK